MTEVERALITVWKACSMSMIYQTMRKKSKALSELCSYIAAIPSKVEREIYISRSAEKFSVSKESITHDVNSAIRKNARYTVKKRREDLSRERSGMSDRVNPDFARHPKLGKLEETVLGLVLFMNEYISVPVDGQILTVYDFSNDYCRRLFGFVKDKYDTGDFRCLCFRKLLMSPKFQKHTVL